MQKIENWDDPTYVNIFNDYISCSNLQEQGQFNKPAPAFRTSISNEFIEYKTITENQLITKINQATDSKSLYVKGILNNTINQFNNNTSLNNVMLAIKNEITSITNGNAIDKDKKLVFLYIFKHSVYFWKK